MTRWPFARGAFIAATLGLYGLVWLRPGILAPWGIPLLDGRWFADLRTLLVISDAHAAGRTTLLWYSDWWYRLHDFGLGAADTTWLGLAGGAAFLLAAFALLQPRNLPEAAYGWLVICSPPVLLGFNRANIDLPIVAALALAGRLAVSDRGYLRVWAPILIFFLAGMKFYPIVAAVALPFSGRTRRESWVMVVVMGVLGALFAWTLHADFQRALQEAVIPYHFYIFGAMQLLPPDAVGRSMTIVPPLLAMALVFLWWRRLPEPPPDVERGPMVWFVLGAGIIVGCFFAGISFSYRLAVCILMLPLLGSLARPSASRPARILSGWVLAGLPVLLWLDGFICLFINLHILSIPLAAAVAFRQLIYGLASWGWIAAVLGLGVMLGRPVWRRMAGLTTS